MVRHSPEAWELMTRLKNRALMFGGDFTFLWDNSHFLNPEDWVFFEGLMDSDGAKLDL